MQLERPYFYGPAATRGSRWADRVARAFRAKAPASWPAWPPIGAARAQSIAARLTRDLGQVEQDRSQAAAICHAAAGERWDELRRDPTALRLLLNQGS